MAVHCKLILTKIDKCLFYKSSINIRNNIYMIIFFYSLGSNQQLELFFDF